MNAPFEPIMSATNLIEPDKVTIDDKYTLTQGYAYMSGTQALVRLPMMQKLRDMAAGLTTVGYISGYRGSPLATFDLNLWKAQKHLAQHQIHFAPGINEDLAATAVWGTQQTAFLPDAQQDGVFAIWYGKGPGVDRSGDALKHANMSGTAAYGGVLALAGDDHGFRSSTMPHHTDLTLASFGIPVLYPATPQEYLDFGLHGLAMSRYTGLWVAMKCVTDVVESSASVDINLNRVQILLPSDFVLPPGGLSTRWPDSPMEQEKRMVEYKWPAAIAYTRANQLNRIMLNPSHAKLGILSAGKAYLDLCQALLDLGLNQAACLQLGIRLYKIGCLWPLDAQGLQNFADNLDEILVVEEKRPQLQSGLKEALYAIPGKRPRILGQGETALSAAGETSPAVIAKVLAQWLTPYLPTDLQASVQARLAILHAQQSKMPAVITLERAPWFCSGCPHNTSTHVPEGSRAISGTGCHYMVNWMDRHTSTITQMGSEGINWLGQRHFVKEKHVFVNLGDGTYFHSGLLAIRAAIADQANMTYKILYNDAIAMTGGQPVEGNLSVPQIVQQVLAEGAAEVVVVSDDPDKYRHADFALPSHVKVHHRDQLDDVQRHLRTVTGVTILIYDQACATERRRKRKRGLLPDQAKRAYIHPEICEGCGDCSAQSNCLSVEPLETELGTKRQINQSSCNKDFSCIKGFCPSFVTLEGAEIRKPEQYQAEISPTLPTPSIDKTQHHYSILVTGVGGTGVITIGALLGMAAHLDHRGVSVLDVTGLAQKGGAVASHIQLSAQPDEIHATRISAASADLLIGCDAIVSTGTEALNALHANTRAIVNLAPIPTSAMVQQPDWHFPASTCEQTLQQIVGKQCEFFDANAIALAALGDAIYANPIILGYAWQKGWIPLTLNGLLKAIELNGVAVSQNKSAFDWGRHAAHDLTATYTRLGITPTQTPAQIMQLDSPAIRQQTVIKTLEDRMQRLTAYQNAAYAQTYRNLLTPLLERDQQLGKSELSLIAARQLYRLMAIKDEYEVARLFNQPSFHQTLRQQFAGEPGKDYQIRFHLAPPILSKGADKPHKTAFGRWITPFFSLLARMKFLRNTPFDIFSYHAERRQERLLLKDYQALLTEIATQVNTDNYQLACQLLALPEQVKGYGYIRMANLEKIRPQWQALHQEWHHGKATPSRAA